MHKTKVPGTDAKMQYPVLYLAMILSTLFETVHAHYGYVQILCHSSISQQTVELTYSVNFNKFEYLRYNSTEEKVVGYTEFGEKWAEDYNKNKIILAQGDLLMQHCRLFKVLIASFAEKTVKPEVIIRSDKEAKGNEKAVLICSAYDFYPKPIRLTWMRDDKVMAADVTSTEELANGDWFYQIHSHLEYFPKPGEKISCVVEHASSHKPMIYHWDPSMPESERSKIILGAVGLLMGVVIAAGGLIYYKRKHTGFYRLPACLLPVQTVNDTELQ
ncbi:rano class II histocompatibility antigen, A beta chain-like [Garra rufa]|uniref:rano class II histocompatibility antigen, A beta chain-like n=1 Tax=Garra rufa TaxID=137080 RepID=UPI003CCECD27